MSMSLSERIRNYLVWMVLAVLVLGAASLGAARTAEGSASEKPTVVLLHGAFADASGWNDVIEKLQQRGYAVIAPANPLRGLAGDSAYVRSVLDTIEGPIVVVGHSYGGMVLTNAAAGHPGVKALVYVAAFAPDLNESVGGLTALNPGSLLGPESLVIRPYPGGLDGYINPDVFREVFAGDVNRRTAAAMAASQRPSALAILEEHSGMPAWATIPSWYMVATQDNVIPPATQLFMAERADAVTVEVKASHVVMISQPNKVTKLIEEAAKATG